MVLLEFLSQLNDSLNVGHKKKPVTFVAETGLKFVN